MEKVILAKEDDVLRQFLQQLREAKQLEVQDGVQHFIVEIKPVTISNEARNLLSKGGPGS